MQYVCILATDFKIHLLYCPILLILTAFEILRTCMEFENFTEREGIHPLGYAVPPPGHPEKQCHLVLKGMTILTASVS